MPTGWKHHWEFQKYGFTCFSDILPDDMSPDDSLILSSACHPSIEDELIAEEERETMNDQVTFRQLAELNPTDEELAQLLDSTMVSVNAARKLMTAGINITQVQAKELMGHKVNADTVDQLIEQLATTGGHEHVDVTEARLGQSLKLTPTLVKALTTAVNGAAFRLTSDCRTLYDSLERELGDDFRPRYMPPEALEDMIGVAHDPDTFIVAHTAAGSWTDPRGDRKVVSDATWDFLCGARDNDPGRAFDPLVDRVVENLAIVNALTNAGFKVRDDRKELCKRAHEVAIDRYEGRQRRAEEAKARNQQARREAAKEVKVAI